mgnify:CR=1 FL=1
MAEKSRTTVRVGQRELSVSNLDKLLYPQTATTKSQVIEYYARIAPAMIPHLTDRCITLKRFPDGVEKDGFFEKRCPKHRPEWLGTAVGPGDRGGDIGHCRMDEPASLVWAANMAAKEALCVQVEALVESTFRRRGSSGPAYPSIVASGRLNATRRGSRTGVGASCE